MPGSERRKRHRTGKAVFSGGGGGIQKQKAWPSYLFCSPDLLYKGLVVSTVAISSSLRGVHLILVVPAYKQCCGSGIRTPGSGSGSGMENNLDSYPGRNLGSLVTLLWVKYSSVFGCGPGSGIFSTLDREPGWKTIGIRDKGWNLDHILIA